MSSTATSTTTHNNQYRMNKDLFSSIRSGNLDATRLFLSYGAQLEGKNSDYETPLAIACTCGYDNIVNYLLKIGAKVNGSGYSSHKKKDSKTTKKVYCLFFDRDVVKSRNTPLMNAIAGGYYDAIHETIVQTLLAQHSLDINATNGFGQGALFIASQSVPKWKQCGALLLNKGADIMIRDARGETALHMSCRHGNMEALQMLVQHYATLVSQETTQTESAETNNNSIDNNSTDNTKEPLPNLWEHNPYLIHVACQHGHVAVLKFLLQHISSPDWTERDPRGRTPLQCACVGPDPDDGDTTNHKKSDQKKDEDKDKPSSDDLLRHFQVVECLVKHGADIQTEPQWGLHALAAAAAVGNHHIVQFLLSHPNTAATAASLVMFESSEKRKKAPTTTSSQTQASRIQNKTTQPASVTQEEIKSGRHNRLAKTNKRVTKKKAGDAKSKVVKRQVPRKPKRVIPRERLGPVEKLKSASSFSTVAFPARPSQDGRTGSFKVVKRQRKPQRIGAATRRASPTGKPQKVIAGVDLGQESSPVETNKTMAQTIQPGELFKPQSANKTPRIKPAAESIKREAPCRYSLRSHNKRQRQV